LYSSSFLSVAQVAPFVHDGLLISLSDKLILIGGRRPKVSGEDAKNKPSLFERKSMKSPSLKWPAPKLPEKLSKIAPSGKPSPEKHEGK
jgi:hypothetical protein